MLSIYYYPDTTFKKSITKIYTSALNISNYVGLRFVTFHAGDIIRLNTVELLRLTYNLNLKINKVYCFKRLKVCSVDMHILDNSVHDVNHIIYVIIP